MINTCRPYTVIMPHEIAMHISGCPCGIGDVKMTPADYLIQCVLKRFEVSRKQRQFTTAPIRQFEIGKEVLSHDVLADWVDNNLLEGLPLHREPLLCQYAYPSGINESDDYDGMRMRAGFYMLKFKSPYSKNEGESEMNHLARVSIAIKNGSDLKPYLYYSHWHGELLSCPCPDEPNYWSVWSDDGEGEGSKDAFIFRTKDEKKILVAGKTQRQTEGSSKRVFTRAEAIGISIDTPSVWFSGSRIATKQIVYEVQYDFSTDIPNRSFAYGRKFSLVIPEKQWESVESFMPPHEDPKELRCWGEDDVIEQKVDGVAYIIIYGIYNSTARRILNDLCSVYGRKQCFSIRGSITIDAIDKSGHYLGSSEECDIFLPSDSVELNLLITKRRGELLQKLYIFRTRIFSSTSVNLKWDGIFDQSSDAKSITGGVEFMINAKDTVAISLKITDLPKGPFSIDCQELESTKIERELSHTSLDFRRGDDD